MKRNPRKLSWLVVSVVCAVLTLFFLTSQFGLYRATVLIEHREHQAAERWLQISGFIWSRGANWHYLSARNARRLDDFNKVSAELLSAQSQGWQVSDLEWEQNLVLLELGRYNQVSIGWDQLFERAGSDGPEICHAYVKLAFSEFRISDARGVLRAWQKDFPDDAEAFEMEGRLEEAYLNWQQAYELHQKAMETASEKYLFANNVARCSTKLGKYQEAIRLIKTIPIDARSVESWELLVESFIELNQSQKALEAFSAANDRYPESAKLKKLHTSILLADGRLDKVIALLENLLEENPADTEAIFMYGQALQASGENERAQEFLELAETGSKKIAELGDLHSQLLQNPRDPALRFEIAMIYYRYKSREEGIVWLKNLLQVFPDYQPAIDALKQHQVEQDSN